MQKGFMYSKLLMVFLSVLIVSFLLFIEIAILPADKSAVIQILVILLSALCLSLQLIKTIMFMEEETDRIV